MILLHEKSLHITEHLLKGNLFTCNLILILFHELINLKIIHRTQYLLQRIVEDLEKRITTKDSTRTVKKFKITRQNSPGESKTKFIAKKNPDTFISLGFHHFPEVLKMD